MNARPPVIVVARVKRVISQTITRARLALSADSQWLSLPGSLELKNTGYQIRLIRFRNDEGRPQRTFAAYDPEGNLIAHAPGNLDGLKQFAEQQARARQELGL